MNYFSLDLNFYWVFFVCVGVPSSISHAVPNFPVVCINDTYYNTGSLWLMTFLKLWQC